MLGNPTLSGQSSTGPGYGLSFVSNFIPAAIGLAFLAGSVLFFGILLAGAIQWTSSGGDKSALEGARGKVTNAIIGIAILFSVYAVVNLIEHFFGIRILTLDLAPLVN